MKKLLIIALPAVLTACSPVTPRTTLSNLPQSANTVIDPSWEKAKSKVMANLDSTPSLAGLQTPVLQSSELASQWGEPVKETSPEGYYRLSYKDPNRPFERLVIYGSPRPFPSLISPPNVSVDTMVDGELGTIEKPQKWQYAIILGRSLRWYHEYSGGGADGAYAETEGFSATDPSGKTGYYYLVVESVTNAAPERFSKIGWN